MEPSDDRDSRKPQNARPDQGPPVAALIGTLVALTMALLFASLVPGPIAPSVAEGLLFWSAMAWATVALFRSDRLNGPFPTAWDQAAILMLASTICGLFVDPAAVEEFLRTHQIGAEG